MSARILLPLWPHVKRYLTVQYGPEMAISERGMPSLLLASLLEKHKKNDPSTVRPNQKLIDGKKFIGYPVFVGDSYEQKRGLYLSAIKIKQFNEAVDDMFREEMYRWCNHPNSTDGTVDFDIYRFRDFYGISEDEMPFDNLKRWYYRERIRLVERSAPKDPTTPQLELVY